MSPPALPPEWNETNQEVQVNTITFSGYQWDVRADTGGPGPNIWDAGNVQVDDEGRLHLKITKNTGAAGKTEWHCAEINTQQRLGLGRYQFQVIGRIDKLDRNVVLGLFNHPTRGDVGRPDGTNEIDIEFFAATRTGKRRRIVVNLRAFFRP
jgi:hypothetical protein